MNVVSFPFALSLSKGIRCGCAVVLATTMAFACTASGAAEVDKKAEPSQAELEQKLETARKRLDEAAREVARLSMSLSDNVVPHMQHFMGLQPRRAVLGINLGPRRGEQPAEGVEVVSVSPGGAAAQAGLKAGDMLVVVNGEALKRDGSESAREKLMALMRDVKPGDTVAVSYRRDGKVSKADLVAQPLADRFFARTFQMDGRLPGSAVARMAWPAFAYARADGVFGSAELVPLTPKLGQYFGTDKGLLVVRAPEDSRLKLEDGDVIVDIDGRTPSSPSHALRILGSYQAGEKMTLNVLRAKKRMSFEITIPDDPRSGRLEDTMFMEHHMLMPAPMPGVPAAPAMPMTAPMPPSVIAFPGVPVDEPV